MDLRDLPEHLRALLGQVADQLGPALTGEPVREPLPAFTWEPAPEVARRFVALAGEIQSQHEPRERVALKRLAGGRELLAAAEELQAEMTLLALVLEVVPKVLAPRLPVRAMDWGVEAAAASLRHDLAGRVAFSPAQLRVLADALGHHRPRLWEWLPGVVLVPFERHVLAERALDAPMRAGLSRFHAVCAPAAGSGGGKGFDLWERTGRLLAGEVRRAGELDVDADEPWARALLAATADDGAWRDLLVHCAQAKAGKPTKGWTREARRLAEQVGAEEVARVAALVLAEIGTRWQPRRRDLREPGVDTTTMLDDRFSDLLRGLAWAAAEHPNADLVAALGRAAERAFHKVRMHGPRSAKVGNACLVALATIGNEAAVAHLTRLRGKIKHAGGRKALEKCLGEVAARLGLSVEELKELAVPDFGMREVGRFERAIGEHTATIGLVDFEIAWRSAAGKPQRAVPAAVRSGHAEELRALRRDAKELEQAMQGQRQRLERLLRQRRSWAFSSWRERYLDHPLVGPLARRLVWRLGQEGVAAAWSPRLGALVDAQGVPLAEQGPAAPVRLWHPLEAGPDEVSAWRERLEAEGIRQPIKQVYREVYVLTDAELRTATYSNRFAGHILKQHQLAALCRDRGWRYALQGQFDSWSAPTLHLPEHDLAVEFLVQGAGEEASAAGIFLYVATDQVRFCDASGTAHLLATIEPLLFSEVMRDVDLFVGVASVGNDPTWADRGEQGAFGAYWQGYAFGELSERARMRRDVLVRLLPRLAVADRCSLGDRFVAVRGERTTYRIHLGSGNVQMEPDHRYLCIVRDVEAAARGAAGAGRSVPLLPFEGDGTLSLILSKLLLLADDRSITDPSILSQLRHLPGGTG
jgi:hypothetical protein